MTDDVCLVASELVGNAVRHAIGPHGMPVSCRLVLKLFADAVVVEVWDPVGGAVVRSRDAGLLSESGRGLAIVEALSGSPVLVYAYPDGGKSVVAVLPRPCGVAPARPSGAS
jgi:anti-sigma regulatory factor (Ser/Thr protein kinase)